MLPADALPCPVIVVVDGDSINCGRERLRLLGIDAPEMTGCRHGRDCVGRDGNAAKDSLTRAVKQLGPFRIKRFGKDRYGRTLVMAWAGETNLNCWQLRRGHAEYVIRWDTGGRVGRACR